MHGHMETFSRRSCRKSSSSDWRRGWRPLHWKVYEEFIEQGRSLAEGEADLKVSILHTGVSPPTPTLGMRIGMQGCNMWKHTLNGGIIRLHNTLQCGRLWTYVRWQNNGK